MYFLHAGSAVRALNFDAAQELKTVTDKNNILLYAQLGSGEDYCQLPGGTSLQQIVDTVSLALDAHVCMYVCLVVSIIQCTYHPQ